MDAALPASPATSISSDDDAFNTESSRLHFGPLKTPERKFMAQQLSLFPPPQTPPPRRSPRLSSPQLPPTHLDDADTRELEDIDDVEQVEQLMNELDEDDDVSSDSGVGTPENGKFPPDEPSSALAEKISRAMDNPSPPPSPMPMLRALNPLFPNTSPEFDSRDDESSDLASFSLNDQPLFNGVVVDDVRSRSLTPQASRVTPSNTSPTGNTSSQMDLITFDSFSIPNAQPSESASTVDRALVAPDSDVQSIDALLSSSPVATRLSSPLASIPTPPIVIVQSPSQTHVLEMIGGNNADVGMVQRGITPPPLLFPDDRLPSTPPLRRSPRRSVSPNPPPQNEVHVSLFPSPSPSTLRSPRRKKKCNLVVPELEIVEDSQDEEDIQAPSPTQPAAPEVTTPRSKDRSWSRSPLSFSREVGSLSPTSADLLTKLVPSFTDTTPLQLDHNTFPSRSIVASPSRPMQSFSIFQTPSQALPSTPRRSASPTRVAITSSPAKIRIQVTSPNEPTVTDTPARRIPMEQAIERGQLSPQKAAQLGYTGPRTPAAGVPQTPARRVLISQQAVPTPSSARSGLRFGSPVRGPSRELEAGTSTALRIAEGRKEKATASVSRISKDKTNSTSVAGSSSLGGRIAKLPFALVASEKPPVASSSKGKDVSQDNPSASISPAKSALKQTTSRIPRIGVKPYARPEVPPKPTAQKPTMTTMRMVDLSKPNGSSSSMAAKVARPANEGLIKGREAAIRHVVPNGQSKASDNTASSILKRKRGTEKASPVKPRMVALRQVPQVIIPKNAPTTTSGRTAATATTTETKKSAGVLRLRRVIDEPPPPAASQSVPLSQEIAPTESASSPQPEVVPELAHSDDQSHESPGSPMQQDPPAGSLQPLQDTPPIETLPPPPDIDTAASGVRRTTRVRKAAIQSDVFTESSIRSTQTRRKAVSQTHRFTDAYSEMSATALKALTTSNTERNQKYLSAKLETEVIRKEGMRPESPAVKIKTVAQRLEEGKSKQRQERAHRRARRSDGDITCSSDLEGPSDDGYSSPVDIELEDTPSARHRRGAGDEEDYETPDRGFKRMKLTEEGFQEDEGELKRRVKWDRGLFTTVFLDEVKLGTRQPMKENIQLKGCLTSTAKAARLDTLGNLPNADSPLAELVPQNVTVKKFVYDNEIEPVPEIIVVKNTRSKSKKAKT